jgi:hypothetical protein
VEVKVGVEVEVKVEVKMGVMPAPLAGSKSGQMICK